MLKIAVLNPMPSASVSTATAVKPGFFNNWRKANLRSFIVGFQRSVANSQFPRPNVQIIPKHEYPRARCTAGCFGHLKLGIGVSLGIGAWSLDIPFEGFFRHSAFVIRHSHRSASIGS